VVDRVCDVDPSALGSSRTEEPVTRLTSYDPHRDEETISQSAVLRTFHYRGSVMRGKNDRMSDARQ